MDVTPIGAHLPVSTFLNILSGLDAQIMVTDPETDEILFANHKMNASYKVDFDPAGKRCWEVYQAGKNGRCDFCPLGSLPRKAGQRVEWENFNTASGHWYHNTSSIIEWTDGRLVHLKHSVNISEAEERAQAMLDLTPLACTFCDSENGPIDCNEEAARMFGVADKQEYLARFADLSPPLQPDGVPSKDKSAFMVLKAFASGREVFEWNHLHADGSLLPTEITLVRVPWRGEYRIAGYARDLRELKARLAEIEKTQSELVCERDRAEASAQAKTNFLANMSHEIRTPLNAIIGMTEIAKRSSSLKRIKYCLEKVDDAAGHLLGVINDILDMSKIESGKMVLCETDFLLEKLLDNVSNVTKFRAEQKRQDFIIKVDSGVPEAVIADRQRLSQVITNLLSNAVKFSPEGGKISLLVSQIRQKGEERTLLFEVVDSGIGISDEQMRRLFQSFEQADGSISRRFGGTGLGLAISRRIVELMGGGIAIDSALNEGSRFYFTVKVRKGKSGYKKRLNPGIDWKNLHLLAVDDAPEIREYFEDITASLGVNCKTAANAQEALALLAQTRFDILFIDLIMPGTDGLELTRKVRELYGNNIIVIMMSAASWERNRNAAIQAGANKFIAKPLLPSPIVDCIHECLGHSTLDAESQPDDADGHGIFAGKRILLVEDIEINREILMALLAETGVTVECAENGFEACEKFAGNDSLYDLILMDIHMPEMDGYEATRRIRASGSPRASSVPIVAMTANVFREDVERCLAAGMDDHVGKPVDKDDIFNKLKRYM